MTVQKQISCLAIHGITCLEYFSRCKFPLVPALPVCASFDRIKATLQLKGTKQISPNYIKPVLLGSKSERDRTPTHRTRAVAKLYPIYHCRSACPALNTPRTPHASSRRNWLCSRTGNTRPWSVFTEVAFIVESQ